VVGSLVEIGMGLLWLGSSGPVALLPLHLASSVCIGTVKPAEFPTSKSQK
jgi:hypothetical protein